MTDVARVLVARSHARTAADAAALAAAQELALPSGADPADIAATYAERNDAILNDCVCAAGTSDATVTVSIVVDGFLLVTGPKTVTARARAVVDLPAASPPDIAIRGHGSATRTEGWARSVRRPYGMRGSKGRIGLVSVAMLCALLPLATAGSPALASGSASTAAASPSAHPNILLIVSDDQAWSTFNRDLMPSVYSQLVDQGVLFKRAYVNTSLCCPSRAQIVSGLYEHDTGVDQNEVLLTRPTFPMALHDAGYRTMLAGKYMNSWPCDPRAEFDQWACVATPEISSLSLVDPMVNVNGVWQRKTGYEPDVLEGMASDFIKSTPADQPFFVMYSPTTPHLPADDTRYADMPVSPPRGPEFNVNTMTAGTPAVLAPAPVHRRGDRDIGRSLHRDGARHSVVRRRGRPAARLARQPGPGHARGLPVRQRLPVRRAPPDR